MSGDARVKSLIDRILRLKEEQDALAADIREVYAEAKGEGYNKTAMGEVVAYLRKVEKNGKPALDEKQADFDLYLGAYDRASGTALATHTHEKFPSQAVAEATRQPEPAGSMGDDIPAAIQEMDRATEGSFETGSEAAGKGRKATATIAAPADLSHAGAGESPATIPDNDVPAFLLKKEAYVLRPNCQKPTDCGGYGAKHCASCERAAREEAA